MDKLIKGLLADSMANLYAIDAAGLVDSARTLHGASPVCTAALGRALMAASMMGTMLKAEDGEVSLIFRGGGITGNIICVGRQDGSVKGCIGNPSADLPPNENGKLPVGKAVGKNGTITVVTDLRMKEPYVGQCALISGEIAEDLASYFAKSQQQPTAVYLGVHMNSGGVTSACGIIVQAMPNCPDIMLEQIEKSMYSAGELPKMIESGMNLPDAVGQLFSGLSFEVLETVVPVLRCDCSRGRLERALMGLGETELLEMADEQHGAELVCHFCNREYHFTEEDLLTIASAAKASHNARKDAHE